jgi:2-hydroxy-3-keto-5-methylthiopentenyl-1-phosphate phosphatase
MAYASDLVFARDALAALLEKSGISYEPWKDFYDIKNFII